ncbi:efflux RND transporter periplasmic adaptor subunit [Mucilaginibacter sp. 44-25]|uniref:efflux RND transporter periplasmic adaptor subunit n=2 Tax=unclassified Mucilaginibacter TaxID=2617802 RepID=UPI000967D85E|nr:efflux RND transporter periplasmic adaptor subunit [Mucilaginibacter sp. 44-25]OJW17308.1 MAG: efflux transporter periplasmic adaptor subunit [Mucilaginibacter sp. 44-25]
MKANIFIIAAVFLLCACGDKKQTADEKTSSGAVNQNTVKLNEAQLRNAGIETGDLVQREISGTLKLSGKIDVPPQNMISVSVPLGGYLKSTNLLPGMHVKKGETIAVIEDQQYIQLQQDYLTAKAKMSVLAKDYQRQKELNASQAASDKVTQQAETDYRADRILVTTLAEKLRLAGIDPDRINEGHIERSVNIHSPIDGFVSKVNINIGKYVSPTDVLFELVNPTDIHLALKVFEKDLGKLQLGQQVLAYTNNNPGKKYDCKILLIGHDLSADRAADVHCHFETYDKTLVPGTYMNAEVEVKNTVSNTLQTEAVVDFEGKTYVFKVAGDKTYEMVEVKSEPLQNGYSRIDIANTDSAKFVTKGAYSLLMMLKNKAE